MPPLAAGGDSASAPLTPEASPAAGAGAAPLTPLTPLTSLTPVTIGAQLIRARETRGLGHAEVAAVLKLQIRALKALECDDYESLPAAPFVRGYLRAYARLLELDPEPLLAAHEARTGGLVVEVKPSPRAVAGGQRVLFPLVNVMVTLGFLVALVVAAALLLGLAPGFEGSGFRSQASAAPLDSPPSEALAEAPPPVSGSPQEAAPEVAASGPGGQPPTRSSEAPAEVRDDILRTRTADGSRLQIHAPGGADQLGFTFTAECWVEVRDGDGLDLHRGLHQAGEVLDIRGRGPFRIQLGYAPAVELTHNGSRVALKPFTYDGVAQLTVGRRAGSS